MKRNDFLRLLLFSLIICVFLTSCDFSTHHSEKTGPFTFVQMCDPQLGMTDYAQNVDAFKRAVDQINALNPDFVVICGDLVHVADDASYADFKAIKEGFQMPCYYAAGNHDVGKQPTAESLQYYRRVIGDDYYSFEHKGASFIVVDTTLWKAPVPGESEKQDAWFREALKTASKTKGPIFVVGHHPLFDKEPDEPDGNENVHIQKRRELLSLFEQYHVAAMLGGHAHTLILNDYNGIQFVNAEATSTNLDGRPLGFRVWSVEENSPPKHVFVPLQPE